MIYQHGSARVAFIVAGPLEENTYLVWGTSGEGFLIDPGDEPERLLEWVRAQGVTVRAIVLTHGHFDHVGAVEPLRAALQVPVLAHPAGLEIYRRAAESAARWQIPLPQPSDPDEALSQGQTLTAGDLRLTVRELFGHAPGHVVLVGGGFVIAGDTLFAGSVGRSDLPGGSHAELITGIRRELLGLPGDTAVYPGHGGPTIVERERRSNPHL